MTIEPLHDDDFWDDTGASEAAPTSASDLNRLAVAALASGTSESSVGTPTSSARPLGLELTLSGQTVGDHAVDLDFLVETVGPLQNALFAVGQAIDGDQTLQGLVPASIRDQTRLQLTGMFSGSCGLRLLAPPTSSQQLDLDSSAAPALPLFEASVRRIVDVLDAFSDNDGSRQLDAVSSLGPRAVKHVKALAKAIKEPGGAVGVSLTGGSAPAVGRMTAGTAAALFEFLEATSVTTQDVQFHGRLVGASLPKRTFEFELEDESIIRGAAGPDAIAYMRNYFDEDCIATVTVTTASHSADGTQSDTYLLMRLA